MRNLTGLYVNSLLSLRRFFATPTLGIPRIRIAFYVLIIVGEGIRLALPFATNPLDHIWSDPGRWWEYASKTGIDTPPMALIDPVFFQAWLSFVAKLTLDIPELVAVYAGLLSAVTPWLWYRFFRELLPSKCLALFGWVLIAWMPSWMGIFSYFMTETLLLPLLGLALWLSWRAMRKGTTGLFLWSALVWTLAALTRGIAAPIAAAVTPFVWIHQHRKWLNLLAMICIIAAILSLTTYRSYVKSGILAPLGHPYLNEAYAKSGSAEISIHYYSSKQVNYGFVYGFSNPSINNKIFAPFSDWVPGRKGTFDVRIDLENQSRDWLLAIDRAEQLHPSTKSLRFENFILLMFGPSWPDTNPGHIVEKFSYGMRLIWFPLFAVSWILLARQSFLRATYRPLAAALLFWTIVQGFTLLAVNEGRYRKPAEGLFIAALLAGFDRRSGGKRIAVHEIPERTRNAPG